MDSKEVDKEIIRKLLLSGVPLSEIKRYCTDHNLSHEIIEDISTELELNWRKSVNHTLILFSSLNTFKESQSSYFYALDSFKKWQTEKYILLNLLFGIFIGIDGNVFVSALIGEDLILAIIAGFLLLIPSIWYITNFIKLRSKEIEYKNFIVECDQKFREATNLIMERIKNPP